MELHKDELKAAGLQVIAVGLGEPKHAERFCGKMEMPLTCVIDSTNDSHFAYGIGRMGILQAVNPNLIKAGMRAAAAGHTQGKPSGDTFMMNASFIVGRDGIVRWTHYNTHPGDHPAIADILAMGNSLREKQPV